jgi:digeranylgeranylglycerophospholipid reductase
MHDVVVIGGGPSGLNVARVLAEGGLDVVVLERKREIGIQTLCTGIVGKEAFKEFSLSNDSILIDIQKVKMISPFSTQITYQHPMSLANVVNREEFDKYLAKDAQSKGVEIELESHVLDISVNSNGVEVLTRNKSKYLQKYTAQVVVIATGIDYKFNKKLGLGYPRDFIYGIQAELESNAFESTTILVGSAISYGAFAWVVPVGEKVIRIGLMSEENPEPHFQNLVKFLNLTKSNIIDKNHIQFRPIAQGLISKTYGDRVLSVGEAAGQVKTTSGGGIYFGLLCSKIASQVVFKSFEDGCFSARALSEYEKLWKRAIQKEILIGYYARKICGKLSDIQIERMFQIAQSDGILPLVREKGKFDWHSELILALMKRMPFWPSLINKV